MHGLRSGSVLGLEAHRGPAAAALREPLLRRFFSAIMTSPKPALMAVETHSRRHVHRSHVRRSLKSAATRSSVATASAVLMETATDPPSAEVSTSAAAEVEHGHQRPALGKPSSKSWRPARPLDQPASQRLHILSAAAQYTNTVTRTDTATKLIRPLAEAAASVRAAPHHQSVDAEGDLGEHQRRPASRSACSSGPPFVSGRPGPHGAGAPTGIRDRPSARRLGRLHGGSSPSAQAPSPGPRSAVTPCRTTLEQHQVVAITPMIGASWLSVVN